MQIEEMSKAGPHVDGVDFSEVGSALGYSYPESRDIVDLMASEGWILPFAGEPPTRVRLTLSGKRQIARLRKTRFRRWWEEGGKTDVGIAIAVLALMVSSALLILRLAGR